MPKGERALIGIREYMRRGMRETEGKGQENR